MSGPRTTHPTRFTRSTRTPARIPAALVAVVALWLVSAAEPRDEPAMADGIPLGVRWDCVESWSDGMPDGLSKRHAWLVFHKKRIEVWQGKRKHMDLVWRCDPTTDPPSLTRLYSE